MSNFNNSLKDTVLSFVLLALLVTGTEAQNSRRPASDANKQQPKTITASDTDSTASRGSDSNASHHSATGSTSLFSTTGNPKDPDAKNSRGWYINNNGKSNKFVPDISGDPFIRENGVVGEVDYQMTWKVDRDSQIDLVLDSYNTIAPKGTFGHMIYWGYDDNASYFNGSGDFYKYSNHKFTSVEKVPDNLRNNKFQLRKFEDERYSKPKMYSTPAANTPTYDSTEANTKERDANIRKVLNGAFTEKSLKFTAPVNGIAILTIDGKDHKVTRVIPAFLQTAPADRVEAFEAMMALTSDGQWKEATTKKGIYNLYNVKDKGNKVIEMGERTAKELGMAPE